MEAAGDDTIFQHTNHPEIEIQVIDASKLHNFTNRDLAFFKIIDARTTKSQDAINTKTFANKQKTNLKREALYVALSVLAKSAAALLIKRRIIAVPAAWRIYAIPYSGASDDVNFDDILGKTKPFDIGINVWLGNLDQTDRVAIYRANSFLVYFFFVFARHNALEAIKPHFTDADIHEFSGSCLNDLLSIGWKKI